MDLQTITIFYIYAQVDAPLRDKLQEHLRYYDRYIKHVYEAKIDPGAVREEVMKNYVDNADILLYLISPAPIELQENIMRLIRKRENEGVLKVIPIHLRPLDWYHEYFSQFRSLPSYGRAVTTYNDHDVAFKEIAEELNKIFKDILKKKYKTLAEKYYYEENYKESLRACEEAITFNRAPDASLDLLKGDILTHEKRFKDALKCYENALTLKPQNTLLLEKKGLSLFYLGEYSMAVARSMTLTS